MFNYFFFSRSLRSKSEMDGLEFRSGKTEGKKILTQWVLMWERKSFSIDWLIVVWDKTNLFCIFSDFDHKFLYYSIDQTKTIVDKCLGLIFFLFFD